MVLLYGVTASLLSNRLNLYPVGIDADACRGSQPIDRIACWYMVCALVTALRSLGAAHGSVAFVVMRR